MNRFKKLSKLVLAVMIASSTLAAESMVLPTGSQAAAYSNITGNASVTKSAAIPTSSTITGIKDELEEGSLKRILADVLTIQTGEIGKIIAKLLSNQPDWLWMIREESLPENVNGQTQLTTNGALTILDYDKLQYATNLSVARTIIHEMVHAYLTLYFKYDALNAIKDFPAILNSWTSSKDADYNKIQHEEIERSFIDDIIVALDAYAATAGLNSIDASVYTDLAWGGLDFQNSTQLTSDRKQRIQNRLLAEQMNKPFGSEKPLGIKIS